VVPPAGLLLTFGCPAERLGVDVPRGGPASVSQEDIQRDAWALLRGGGSSHVEHRLQEMHTLPGFGDSYRSPAGALCGRKDGRGAGADVLLAPIGLGASAAAATAALVSLAKAWDVPEPPARTVVFCATTLEAYALEPAVPLHTASHWVLGPLAGTELRAEAGPLLGGAATTLLSTGPDALHGSAHDPFERLDWRGLADRVREVHARVLARD
jgi:hypothetical protein